MVIMQFIENAQCSYDDEATPDNNLKLSLYQPDKYNLVRGTVLKLFGYSYPERVILSKIDGDKFGIRYECIDLDNFNNIQTQAYTLHYPEDNIKGIHTEITLNILPEPQIQKIINEAERAKNKKQIKKEQKEKRESEEIYKYENSSEYNHLERKKDSKKSDHALAAFNIKRELKKAFPPVKFSVKSSSFSMGNSVDISYHKKYAEIAPIKEVKKICDKYQEGYFNSMEDIYEYSSSCWNTVFGGSKFVDASVDRFSE